MNELPVRKSIRLQSYDYSTAGAYFVTLCVKDGHQMLGTIVGDDGNRPAKVQLSETGQIAQSMLTESCALRKECRLAHYVIMPNHIHLILHVQTGEAGRLPSSPTKAAVPSFVRGFKGAVSRALGYSIWQRSYHDHIIRDEAEYHRIAQYIDENPARWESDEYHTK